MASGVPGVVELPDVLLLNVPLLWLLPFKLLLFRFLPPPAQPTVKIHKLKVNDAARSQEGETRRTMVRPPQTLGCGEHWRALLVRVDAG